jgi:hypothetical protein
MDRVFRIDERLAALAKPPLHPASAVVLGKDDCVVVCAGFEERAVAFLREVSDRSAGFKVVAIEYSPPYADNRLHEVLLCCERTQSLVCRLTYDRKNPAGFGDILKEAIGLDAARVFIDVSGMSRLLIIQSIVALCDDGNGWRRCQVAYSEAQGYPPNSEEVHSAILACNSDPMFAALFLSSGVFDVTVVPELSPSSLGANQSRLVLFPSFNCDQLTALRAELQPSRIGYIHGVPPNPASQWRTDAIARLNRLEGTRGPDHYHTSTLDYRETLDCLLEIYSRYSVRDRILISPTGSKMQTVAVGVFRALIKDVQIVYPTPREFRSPQDYTTGVGQLHVLPLAAFGEVLGSQWSRLPA